MPGTFQLKGLREKRADIKAKLQRLGDKIRAEQRAMSSDEREQFEKLKDEFVNLGNQVKSTESALNDLDTLIGQGDGDDGDGGRSAGRGNFSPRGRGDGAELAETKRARQLAFVAWARAQHGIKLTREMRVACQQTRLDPGAKWFRLRLPTTPLYRDQSTSGSAGGYTIPQDFSDRLDIALKSFSNVRGVCETFRTDTGATMPYPTLDDTSNTGELLAENTGYAAQDATFGVVNFASYKYSSKGLLVSTELLNDSYFNLDQVLADLMGERLGRIQGTHFTTGSGTGQPQGIITGATLGKTAASTTAFTPDEVVSLLYQIDPAYRSDPSFAFMCHDAVKAYLATLKDAMGRPLLGTYQDGFGERVMGFRCVTNQFMDSAFTTGKKLLLCGAMSKYKIRDVGEVRVRRLDERYADKDQVGFISFMRSDGHVINAAALKYLALA